MKMATSVTNRLRRASSFTAANVSHRESRCMIRAMRRVAIALVGLCGCNQIFGLKDTQITDGPADAPFGHVKLVYQIANTDLLQPDPTLEYRPIPDVDVSVLVGGIGEPLQP